MQNDTLVGVDIAKEVFEIAVSVRPGRVVSRHRLPRERFLPFFEHHPQVTVVMEARGSAHFWARQVEKLGHSVALLPPRAVRPYVLRNKTDRTDTQGLLEAFRNEEIRRVPIKNPTRQLICAPHRLRSGWLAERVRSVNALRGHLREFGLFIPAGRRHVLPEARAFIDDPRCGLPDALRPALAAQCEQIADVSIRIESVETQLEVIARDLPSVSRLRSLPGVGLLTATALYSFIGDPDRFPSGRHMASFIGLAPREHSTGWRRRLGRISKRGDDYLRLLLINGSRSILWHAKRAQEPDHLRAWALRLEGRSGHNKAATALANKLARIAWAVWRHDRDFQPLPQPQPRSPSLVPPAAR